MSLLLDDLLDVTRLKENMIRLQIKDINLQSVLAGIVDIFKMTLNGKPIRLHIDIDDSFPSVQADENRLIQILFNLIHNAVKYTDEGCITIRATAKDKLAHIHIEDTGIGIEEEALQTIFQPYEQGNFHSTRSSGGMGLGLSICKQLVELHGGTLTVHSTLGKGSVFTFTLPLFKNVEQATAASFSLEKAQQPVSYNSSSLVATTSDFSYSPSKEGFAMTNTKPKILAVDDDMVNLNVLLSILEMENYEVVVVTNAQQAMIKLENELFDLVISDVMMPYISGYELTRFIRERFTISELPVLLLTARNRSEDLLTGYQVGANDYLIKPVEAWELKARVRALLELKVSIEERLRMEGAWLQSQIQPHFLYNTLNSIAALGMIDFDKMQTLLEEFSNYLRLSIDFSNSEPIVPLEHELSLVRSYLYIESERFGDRLKVHWEIDSEINAFVPPLSIQPLVENAVKHGILQRRKGGTIYIRIESLENGLRVSIIDNGKGMTDEERKQLLIHKGVTKQRTGVGLQNVDRRLKQLYGKGLEIYSVPTQGTTVCFTIPKKG
ncbi:ATP-binding protein [Caldalkalibacillus mannanilyticus]|uniref:ATP-binding protein n=1 Tax=Caldalkalibacillus mannanilyticus TaxID=1418 RepID=UPI000ACBCFBF|nr:ATP-binding protein [Caldalkalibacillus mannanilyticus]